jgi:glycine dehydrogenase
VPAAIRQADPIVLPPGISEAEALRKLRLLAGKNKVFTSLIGQGYYGTILPPVIQRNILESPAWYTAYTPYQPEISQGRLEALLNFQTMISELCMLDIANASLLDEATAAAEAMAIARREVKSHANDFFVAAECHPQTIAVVRPRRPGLEQGRRPVERFRAGCSIRRALPQYPERRRDPGFRAVISALHAAGARRHGCRSPCALAAHCARKLERTRTGSTSAGMPMGWRSARRLYRNEKL